VQPPFALVLSAAAAWIIACTGVPLPRSDSDDTDHDSDEQPEGMAGWELSWAVRAGGDEHGESYPPWPIFRESGSAIAVLEDGSVYLSGEVAETAVFGDGEPNETVFPDNIGWSDGFLAKYEANGSLSWVRRIGGPEPGIGDYAHDVIALDDGSAVVVGHFNAQEIILGQGEPNETVLSANNEYDAMNSFVARYAPNGDLIWAVKIPKSDETTVAAYSVAALPDGRILVAGTFRGTLWPGEDYEIYSLPDGSEDGFLAWYEEDGSISHAVRIGNDYMWPIHSVAATEDGGAIAAMWYGIHVPDETFGAGEPNETVLHCEDEISCASLARYDGEGRLLWVRDLGIFCWAGTLRLFVLETGDVAVVARFAHSSDPDGDGEFFEIEDLDTAGAAIAVYRVEDGDLVWARMGKHRAHTSYGFFVGGFAMPGGGLTAAFTFEQTLEFEGDDAGQRPLVSAGKQDIALMSFSATGEILWMHRMGGEGEDWPISGGHLDGSSLWLTGLYGSNPFVATSGHGDDIALPLDGYTDVFLMRFDATTIPTE